MPDKSASPGAQSLVSLVEVQAESIVSKMLLKSNGGSVTLFAFGKAESLSEHTAPFDALLMVVDGIASIKIDGEAHEVGAGEVIHLPAAVPHAVEALTDMRLLLTMLRDDQAK